MRNIPAKEYRCFPTPIIKTVKPKNVTHGLSVCLFYCHTRQKILVACRLPRAQDARSRILPGGDEPAWYPPPGSPNPLFRAEHTDFTKDLPLRLLRPELGVNIVTSFMLQEKQLQRGFRDQTVAVPPAGMGAMHAVKDQLLSYLFEPPQRLQRSRPNGVYGSTT